MKEKLEKYYKLKKEMYDTSDNPPCFVCSELIKNWRENGFLAFPLMVWVHKTNCLGKLIKMVEEDD